MEQVLVVGFAAFVVLTVVTLVVKVSELLRLAVAIGLSFGLSPIPEHIVFRDGVLMLAAAGLTVLLDKTYLYLTVAGDEKVLSVMNQTFRANRPR